MSKATALELPCCVLCLFAEFSLLFSGPDKSVTAAVVVAVVAGVEVCGDKRRVRIARCCMYWSCTNLAVSRYWGNSIMSLRMSSSGMPMRVLRELLLLLM